MLVLSALAACGDGEDGRDGAGVLSATFPEAPGENCRQGGNRIGFGTDTNRDGTLQEEEVTASSYDCNGDACALRAYADCRNADLRNLVLVGYIENTNLRGIDLSGADLSYLYAGRGLSLVGANLSGAKLDGALIESAIFLGANLSNASLTHAVVAETVFDDANLDGADFSDAIIDYGSFQGARALGVKMNRASLYFDEDTLLDADFTGADFANATFDVNDGAFARANFSNASFVGANFGDARFDELDATAKFTGANFSFATFFDADIEFLALADAGSFTNAYFGDTDLPVDFDVAARGGILVDTNTRTDYSNVDFSLARFDGGPSLSGATLTGAKFTGAQLRTDLTDVIANGVDFSGARIIDYSLSGGKFQGAKFVGTYFQNISVSADTDFSTADFSRARLNDVNMAEAKLDGATLSHASLLGANMTVQAPVTPINWTGAFASSTTTWTGGMPAGVVIVQPGTALTSKDLAGIWLAGTNYEFTAADDWSGVNLTGARLYDAMNENSANAISFAEVNLANANFTDAVLWERRAFFNSSNAPTFRGANLTGANFTNAQLVAADFQGANLTNATMTNANLLCSQEGDLGEARAVTAGVTWTGAICADGTSAESCDRHRLYSSALWAQAYCRGGF